METLFTVLLFIFAISLIVNTVFGISKDGGPLARATEVVATLFIVSALLLYLVK